MDYTSLLEIIGISVGFTTAGGIAVLSIFDVPELQAQQASRSLPAIRWLFSRGSHVFPIGIFVTSASFACLAFRARPAMSNPLAQLIHHEKFSGNATAALLALSSALFTRIMIPTNFRLIELNKEKGGFRSAISAHQSHDSTPDIQSTADSVAGEGEAPELSDLSGPQTQTKKDTTAEEDREVSELLQKFGKLNAVRAALMFASALVGLAINLR